jgi:formamidopyrimidine-DNA glycosylase
MPELPEVETIKNDLRALVLGRRITGVSLRDPALVRRPEADAFAARLGGQTLVGAERRGKYLLIGLSAGYCLVVQLAITGQLTLSQPREPVKKDTRLILDLDDGSQLRLWDQNGYAKVQLLPAGEVAETLKLDDLGPDPTSSDFTLSDFLARLRGRRGRIKPLLLDQSFLAGLGNIYADEALFLARIHPARRANTLSEEEAARLFASIREVLLGGIAKRGTTIATYRDVLGRKGAYQNELRVFRRAGKPCPRCGTPIVVTRIGGRDTHYCPRCQPPVEPEEERPLAEGGA